MINRVVLVGRLTKDIDLRYTPSGAAVAKFILAVNRTFTNARGEKEADFVNCTVWRKQAESAANFLSKGSLVGIEGRIQTGSFEGQDGKRVYTTEVVADSVQFLEPKNSSRSQTERQAPEQPADNSHHPQQSYGGEVHDDDLPF